MYASILSRSIYASIFNSLPIIWTASAKNCRFHVQQPIFLFPLETPLRLSCNNVVWMERQFNACQTPRCMHLSIFNSFRVTRCLSQCVSPKIAIFSTFLFPLETPLGQSRYMLYGFKENSMLTNCLAACTHLSSTVYQLFEPQVQKIVTYRSPHFCFPCAVVQSVEYRTRNREVAGSTHTRSTASNLEQVANQLRAQANSASYPQRNGKWVVAKATGEGLVWLIGAMVCASCAVGPTVH